MKRFSLTTLVKKRLIYANVAIFRFLVALEYAVVLPTLWPYLSKEYNSSPLYYSLCLSGFYMTSLPASLIFGFLNDLKYTPKSLVSVGNILQVCENSQLH